MYRILLIDDDGAARADATAALSEMGHAVVIVDAADAIAAMEREPFDVVMASVSTPPPLVQRRTPTAIPENLVYLAKPFTTDDVVSAITDMAARERVRDELEHARCVLANDAAAAIVGTSTALQQTLMRVRAMSESEAAVLLTGESGTGKELIAREVHARSPRRARPFVAVNCAAFPEALLEAELFGYERGAFTGALQRRDGRFKAADGGTLFLDEINGLSLAAQAKLLRVLQDGTFQPVGTNTTHAVNVRLISATNQELKRLVAERTFREDLYYRVKVLELPIPPLRERAGDIPLLVQHFLGKYAAPDALPPTLSPRAWASLTQHDFPGNVRELEHAVQHAVVVARGGEIDLEHLPRDISLAEEPTTASEPAAIRPLADAVREFERAYLLRAIDAAGGNKTRAARTLGISRKCLWEKLTKSEPPSDQSSSTRPGRYRH